MYIFNTKETLQDHLRQCLQKKESIGFVPTMGALHIGHISLVAKSFEENTYTVVSVFVNPTQFNNKEDLDNYPRTLESDIALLKVHFGDKIIVFAPSPQNLYDGEVVSLNFNFGKIENQMEGKFRPGHFDGVGTVITHLFNAVQPTKAYFGEKDYQQLQVVRKLVELQEFLVEIVGCDIYRESSGLAYSSRNQRLSVNVKEKASIIYKTLKECKEMFGTKSATDITSYVKGIFEKSEMFDLEYFEIADTIDLETVKKILPKKKYRAFIAVFGEEVRLIDNIALN